MYRFLEIFNEINRNYPNRDQIGLHDPYLIGNEKKYLLNAIDSNYVSSVGAFVNRFEENIQNELNIKSAIATCNGTSALQVSLQLAGVKKGDEVITQALSFIATSNVILYNSAIPVFLDVDIETMGLSPLSVSIFLEKYGELRDDGCYNKKTGNRISACLPMHTFGFPVKLKELISICDQWKIPIVEDCAESLGSLYDGKHTGTFGLLSALSFNGNKIITTGGGGAILTNNLVIGKKAKHLTTTAKKPHDYEYIHDELGFNFRMPNLNAALGCAQLEKLNIFIQNKRNLALKYDEYFKTTGIEFMKEPKDTVANYWLMAIKLNNKKDRDLFLKESIKLKIQCRPIWQLLFRSNMHSNFYRDQQENAKFLEERIVNIPSGVRL